MSDLTPESILDDLNGYMDEVRDWMKENPTAVGVLLIALQRLQGMIKDAGLPELQEKPIGADAIREMARGAIGNLQESQTALEQFIHVSLEGAEALVGVIEMLVKEFSS
jgi:hypothetical protein